MIGSGSVARRTSGVEVVSERTDDVIAQFGKNGAGSATGLGRSRALSICCRQSIRYNRHVLCFSFAS